MKQEEIVSIGEFCEKRELQKRIDECSPWFQNVSMPYDLYIIKRGHDNPSSQYEILKSILPNMENRTLLDVGCNDGYFEVKFERELKIKSVDTIDFYDKHIRQTQLVIDAYNLKKCKVYKADIETMKGLKDKRFDIVAFLGVLYHVENMIKTLQNVFDLAK